MDSKKEDLLIQCFHALKMRKEATLVALSQIKTDKQAATMLHWIKEHYKENPSEDLIIHVAQEVRKDTMSENSSEDHVEINET